MGADGLDTFRGQVADWLADNRQHAPRDYGAICPPDLVDEGVAWQRRIYEAGFAGLHWPADHGGRGLSPAHHGVWVEECAKAGVPPVLNMVGLVLAGGAVMAFGDDAQKERHLRATLSAEHVWCQLFSEPGAGSDLGSLSTRAERDGDRFVVNGQKIWTTGAHYSRFGILIARTDPAAPKHRGITYFICPMDLPGIEVRNIRNIAGADSFNEVFFTDVRIPHANVVGEVNDGWRLAKVTLGNERVSLSSSGVLWGAGPTAADIVDEARRAGVSDAVMRQRIAAIWSEHVILDIIRLRTLTARLRGEQPGPEASIRKIMADEHGQRAMEIARDLIGADAMLVGTREGEKTLRSRSWYSGYMFSRALTIGGGTGEVQRNILGERVLGLPAEPDESTGRPWSDTMRNIAKGTR